MATRDVRKETPAVICELRVRAVELMEQGLTHETIANALDVPVAASRLWWRMYREGGKSGLAMGRRGRPSGVCRTLTQSQEKIVIKPITDKTPEQLKLPVRTHGHYLKRWGFTPQRPKKVAYEQQPAAVRKWIEEQYPGILKRAKAEKVEILCGDETGVSNQDHSGRGYAPKGKTPVVRGLARRVTTSMISAIGNRGDARFMIYKGGLKVDIFIKFLNRLIKGAKRKVYLIVDNLRVYKAKAVNGWLAEHLDKIELFYLPPYSPELNPDEYLNNTVKRRLRNQPAASTHSELHSQLAKVMRSTQKTPALIRSLFKHPAVAYVA